MSQKIYSDRTELEGVVLPSAGQTRFLVIDEDKKIKSEVSGVETIYIELTKTQLDTAIANSELVPGALYKITEVETWMKQGETTKAIYLHAISNTELEKRGMGEFYVPKYNKEQAGYGIWSGELWQKTNGAMGTEPSYNADDVVIWGGKHWKNITGNYGTFINHYELDRTNWEEIPVDFISIEDTYYDVRINIIEYDYANDMITYRKDDAGNEISTSYENWMYIESNWFKGDNYNPIKVFQWGNEYDSNVGVGFNIIENGIFECINQRGHIYGNTLNNAGIYDNTLENNGRIHDNTLNNGRITDNTIENNGRIEGNTIINGYIRLGTSNSINNKRLRSLTINTGDIGGDLGIDLSSATLVYEDFERIVFKNSIGVTKIRYFDEKEDLVVADLTD